MSKKKLPKMAHTFKACHKFARMSPFKARYVADLIRHRGVSEALTMLKFNSRRAAKLIDKVLRSAIANAMEYADREKINIPMDQLVITESFVDEGPRMKRWRARSRGIANPIMKRNSHIHIEIGLPRSEEDEKLEKSIKDSREKLDKAKSKLKMDDIEETTDKAEEKIEAKAKEEKSEEAKADKKTEAKTEVEPEVKVEKKEKAKVEEPKKKPVEEKSEEQKPEKKDEKSSQPKDEKKPKTDKAKASGRKKAKGGKKKTEDKKDGE